MTIEVDQSIKVEQTFKDTVIGIAWGKKSFACVLSRQVKRRLQKDFRREGRARLFVYRTFVAAVILTVMRSEWKYVSDVIIDVEYRGQDQKLRSIFLEMWSRVSKEVPDISFREIGKRSLAHHVCYDVMKKDREPDAILTYGEIKRLVLK